MFLFCKASLSSLFVQDNYTNLHGHSSQLDIVAHDEAGRLMNIEVQRDDEYAIPKRARYYSSLLDSYSLDKGETYDKLRDTYVIFITEHDYFGNKLPIYHIHRTIEETGAKFVDGSHIVYVNGEIRDNTPLGRLMHDFSCTKASNMYYNVIADRVRMFKETKEGKKYMCKILDETRAEGEASAMNATALRMLQAGKYALNEIAAISGLSLEEVKAIQAKLAASSRS